MIRINGTLEFQFFYFGYINQLLMPRPSAWTKYFLSDKNVFPKLKKDLLVKWMENDFLAMKKLYFFSIGKKLLSGQKIFCPGRWTGHKRILKQTTVFPVKLVELSLTT